MDETKTFRLFKKDITKKFIKCDNDTLITMLEEGKRDRVIELMLPMVIYVVEQFNLSNDFDDLIGVGNLALCRAVDNYKPEKSRKFISYCRSCIKWGVLDYLNRQRDFIHNPTKRKKSKKEIQPSYAYFYDDLVKFEKGYEENYVDNPQITRKVLEEILLTLPIKYSKVQMFLDYQLNPDMTFKEVGLIHDYTFQHTSKINSEILSMIKSNPTIMKYLDDLLRN
jgi:RNA polymerase sigma factor (sigma-70 family)